MAIENLKQDFYIDYFLAQEKPQVDVQARKTCLPPCHPFTINTARKRNSEIQVWESFSCAKLELKWLSKCCCLMQIFKFQPHFYVTFLKKTFGQHSNFFAQVQLPMVVKACFHGAKTFPPHREALMKTAKTFPPHREALMKSAKTFPPHREALMKSANPFWQKSWKHIQVCNILRG